ncbi:hypothetical protein KY312_02110, partial [Candidatus Woesearchaeota archaeon]|nr:hypothetical protein [Candidatus Woesearchaeota archaeon]
MKKILVLISILLILSSIAVADTAVCETGGPWSGYYPDLEACKADHCQSCQGSCGFDVNNDCICDCRPACDKVGKKTCRLSSEGCQSGETSPTPNIHFGCIRPQQQCCIKPTYPSSAMTGGGGVVEWVEDTNTLIATSYNDDSSPEESVEVIPETEFDIIVTLNSDGTFEVTIEEDLIELGSVQGFSSFAELESILVAAPPGAFTGSVDVSYDSDDLGDLYAGNLITDDPVVDGGVLHVGPISLSQLEEGAVKL